MNGTEHPSKVSGEARMDFSRSGRQNPTSGTARWVVDSWKDEVSICSASRERCFNPPKSHAIFHFALSLCPTLLSIYTLSFFFFWFDFGCSLASPARHLALLNIIKNPAPNTNNNLFTRREIGRTEMQTDNKYLTEKRVLGFGLVWFGLLGR